MTRISRTLTYDPEVDLRASYPSWFVTSADFGGRRFSHMICWPEKTIVVDPGKFGDDQDWARAHVLVHLEQHMDHLDQLTPADCDDADFVARVRLDRECDRIPLGGNPPL